MAESLLDEYISANRDREVLYSALKATNLATDKVFAVAMDAFEDACIRRAAAVRKSFEGIDTNRENVAFLDEAYYIGELLTEAQ